MNGQGNFSGVPQKTLERLAQKQAEIAALEKEVAQRIDDITDLQDKLSYAVDLRDEIKRTVEEFEEMLSDKAVPQEPSKVNVSASVARRLASRQHDQRGLLAVPMPPIGERVLQVLWQAGKPLAAIDISQSLGLHPQSIGRALANLKRDGLDSKDPETGLWTITQKGITSAEATP